MINFASVIEKERVEETRAERLLKWFEECSLRHETCQAPLAHTAAHSARRKITRGAAPHEHQARHQATKPHTHRLPRQAIDSRHHEDLSRHFLRSDDLPWKGTHERRCLNGKRRAGKRWSEGVMDIQLGMRGAMPQRFACLCSFGVMAMQHENY